MVRRSLDDPTLVLNREASWLAFNRRVIEEALNRRQPLFERLRFLSISASNLDEFYMVRVAGLMGMVHAGVSTPSADGLTPADQLAQVDKTARELIADQQRIWSGLDVELRKEGVCVVTGEELQPRDRAFLVRVGPLATVPEADAVLDHALHFGIEAARIAVE